MQTVLKLFVVGALSWLVFGVVPSYAQSSMHVTPIETAQLPRFCWAQLNVPNISGDEFYIRDCGPAANHYCPALIYMIRARSERNKNSKRSLLGQADQDIRYTEVNTAPYPKCSIRDHVIATRAELNHLITMYGFKYPTHN